MTSHWGEIPLIQDTESGIAAIEREQVTKPRPLDIEGHLLHQPSGSIPSENSCFPASKFTIDPLTSHTIKLIQHARTVRALIQNLKQQQEVWKSGLADSQKIIFPATPPIPGYTGPPVGQAFSGPLPFKPKHSESDFSRGIGEAPPVVDSTANRQLLRRSVAAIMAHAGYEVCKESILEMVTDVSHEFFLNLTHSLRSAVDNEALHGKTGFPDAVVQVFHETGIGSLSNISKFYEDRIITYHQSALQTCQQLVNEYDQMKLKDFRMSDELKSFQSVKEEPVSDINFPELEHSDEIIDAEQLLQLEGLGGFDMNTSQDGASSINNEDDAKWTQQIKSESSDTKVALDSFDHSDQSGEPPTTPRLGSETSDSLHDDPGSVPILDSISPSSIGIKPPKPKKKRKR